MTPGALSVSVDDRHTTLSIVGGDAWTMPIGVATLVERELEQADRPAPAQLTNALGIVTDHLDDVLREAPTVVAARPVACVGPHAIGLARVELGLDVVPAEYTLSRADADEVFRTLVAEPSAERLHNPGLDPAQVHTIVATCCVVLAVMRRLELDAIGIGPSAKGDH